MARYSKRHYEDVAGIIRENMDQAKYSIAVGMFGIGMLLGVILGMARGVELANCL